MPVSGSRSAAYQDSALNMVSSIPEGGSLACKQCGAFVCSLKSLVSSVSTAVRGSRSASDAYSACVSLIGDLLVSAVPLGGAVNPPLPHGRDC